MEYSTHSATLTAWSPMRSRYFAIVGFTHRFYEAEVLVAWLDGLRDSVFADTFTDLAWLGIEAAVYPQALAVAPALEALRREHAERFLADLRDVDLSMQQRMLQTGVAQTLKAARCHEVLGGRSGLRNPWDRGLYEALELPPQPSAEALTEALDAVLHRFFRFRFRTGARRAYHVVLPEMLHKFLRRVLPVHVVLGSVCGVDEEERFVARVPRAGGVLLIHGHEGVVSVLARRDFGKRRNRRGLESLCRSRIGSTAPDWEKKQGKRDCKRDNSTDAGPVQP